MGVFDLIIKAIINILLLYHPFQICVQEVTDVKALAKICDELNEPMLKRVLEWRENSRRWKYFAAESCKEGRINGLGFIYDNHQCRFLPKLSHEMDLSLENVVRRYFFNSFHHLVTNDPILHFRLRRRVLRRTWAFSSWTTGH